MLKIFAIFHSRTEDDDVVDELVEGLTVLSKLLFHFTVDTFKFFINLITFYYYLFIFAAVIFVLYITREIVLEGAHFVGIVTLDITGTISTVVNSIIDVLNTIAKAITVFTAGSVHVGIDDIDVESKIRGPMTDAKDLLSVCNGIDTMSDEVFHTLKLNTHKVCSVVRYMYPIDFVYGPLKALLGWMIFNPSPVGQAGCEPPRLYELCYIFNFYQMVKFLAYAFFWFIVIKSYLPTINCFFEDFLFKIIILILRSMREFFKVLMGVLRGRKHSINVDNILSELLV